MMLQIPLDFHSCSGNSILSPMAEQKVKIWPSRNSLRNPRLGRIPACPLGRPDGGRAPGI